MNFQENLIKYAKLTVSTCVNVQMNQILCINAPIEAAPFVRLLSKEAFDLGAKDVHIFWSDPKSSLIRLNNADESVFSEYPNWLADGKVEFAKEGAAFLSISAPDPELFKDANPKYIAESNKASSIALKEYKKLVSTGNNAWGVVVYPTLEWAKKVFPTLSSDDALEKLWEKVFLVTRTTENDPVVAWKEHVTSLKTNMEKLNKKQYTKLFYKAPGTDLTVELPENHSWIGGGLTNNSGVYFVPNIPTEEAFTAPNKYGVNGTLASTKPLNYGGSLINDFSFTFKDGKIVDFSAKEGYETLERLIATDDGSSYLGEVALVPDDSPISNTDLIYYNTLFDENASCHFAIGNAYAMCVKDGTKMDKEELEANNINTSLTHVDFMIGSKDLQITGQLADGSIEDIFVNGNFAK